MRSTVRRGPPAARLLAPVLIALSLVPARAAPEVPADAVTREASLFVTPPRAPVVAGDAITREVSVFASPPRGPVTAGDAITREVSLYAAPDRAPVIPTDANTREVSVYVQPPGVVIPGDAITREASIYIAPYQTPEVMEALRIAAGFAAATPAEAARLDVSNASPSGGRVDLPDVAEILRRVLGLVP
jgi:hypothetical protein